MEIPIGTILPYYGDINSLRDANYKVCNGTLIAKVEFQELFSHLITVNPRLKVDAETCRLPDLTGLFLRGVDAMGAIDVDKRIVGDVQTDATKFPNNSFSTDLSGGHNHEIFRHHSVRPAPNNALDRRFAALDLIADDKDRIGETLFPATPIGDVAQNGKHSHRVIGGDAETRPKNMAITFIIRAKP